MNTIDNIMKLADEYARWWPSVTGKERQALRAAIEQALTPGEPTAWVYPEALEAFRKGKPWTAYGADCSGPHSDGVKRIYLYAAQPYDQQALELCDKCGWKTLIPGEGCLNCERKPQRDDTAGKMIAAGNRMAAMLDTSLTAPVEQWPDEAEIDAALKEWRFAVDPCPPAEDGKGIDAPPQPKPNATVPALNDADSVDCPRCGHCCPDDTALLRQALEALEDAANILSVEDYSVAFQDDAITALRERLK